MALTEVQRAALKDELLQDPQKLGYAPYTPDGPGHLANLLNKPTDFLVRERFVTTRTVLAELSLEQARTLLGALRAAAQVDPVAAEGLEILRRDPGLDVSHGSTHVVLDSLVAAGALPRTVAEAVVAMGRLPASRAVVLFGLGVVVSDRDVQECLR